MTAIARAAGLLVLAAVACSTPKAKNPDRLIGKGAERVDPGLLPKRHAADPKFPTNPPSFPYATIPEHSVGPFLARRGATAMGAYIAPAEGAKRRLVSLPLGADGAPLDPQAVAEVTEDATMMIVRPAGGEHGAFLAAWTALTDRGEALSVVGITALGLPRSTPIEITRTQDDIVWIEALPTPSGEVVVWAEQTRSADANLFALALEPDGKPRGLPSAIVRGVVGWQAVSAGAGAGVAILTRHAGVDASKSTPATAATASTTSVSWLRLDADAHPVGAPLVVATTPQRVVDVDVAHVGEQFVFAWTRRGGPEPTVMVASVDGNAKLTAPRPITERSGGAALVDIVGGAHGGVLAWEETTHLARGTRRLHLVPVVVAPGADGVAPTSDAGVLEVDTSGAPEVVPLERGYAVLARVRTCPEPAIPGVACDEPPSAPTFIRLDERFNVKETQPILLDETQDHARLAWGLSCEGTGCLVLDVGTETPAEVRVIHLVPTSNHWRAPLPLPPPADAPRVLAVDTIASADLYSEIAVAPVKGRTLLASITTESAAAGDGTRGATVSVAPLDASGDAHAPSVSLTRRALPEGGVTVAGGEGIEGGAVGWVARENGHSAVHVTRVDATGKRTNDIQLTTAAGDASDVALAWAGGGWIVAWVDTRDGNGEVYETKVDPSLRRVAREVRVTNAPGDASDVTVLAEPGRDGPVVWVAWADPRESPHDGIADIFVARVRGTDATLLGPEARVLATVPHSRSPALAAGPGSSGPSIAWIEEAPSGADPNGASVYGAMIGALDDAGRLASEPIRVRGAGEGFPTSIAIDRVGPALHVLFTRSTRDDIFLDAMSLGPGATPRAFALFGLEGPPSMDVALAILGDGVYFNDQSEGQASGRIRRATLEWKH